MPFAWDADILFFLWVTAKLLFGIKARLRRAGRAIPLEEDLEEVPENTLSQKQKNYIEKYDLELARLNYFPACTYRVTNFRNLGKNLLRHYSNGADNASCSLTVVEIRVKVDGVELGKTSSSVTFRTKLADGRLLATRNASLKSLQDNPPYRLVQEYRQTTDLAKLKARHDARAGQLGASVPPARSKDEIFAEHRAEHRRFSTFQLERGIYRPTADGQAYELTDKAHLRAVRNHYLPFTKRVSLREWLLTALVGAVLPLFAILKAAPEVARSLHASAATALPIKFVVIAIAYLLGGLIIGAVSERASLQWILLVSYVPAHLLAGWTFGWFPYSTVMFLASFFVIREKRRRELIFQT
jgi:hypothetical protein